MIFEIVRAVAGLRRRDPALAGTESAGAQLFGPALAAVLRVLSQGYTTGRVVSVAAGCGCDHSETAVGAVAAAALGST
jgi:hypothetical protein